MINNEYKELKVKINSLNSKIGFYRFLKDIDPSATYEDDIKDIKNLLIDILDIDKEESLDNLSLDRELGNLISGELELKNFADCEAFKGRIIKSNCSKSEQLKKDINIHQYKQLSKIAKISMLNEEFGNIKNLAERDIIYYLVITESCNYEIRDCNSLQTTDKILATLGSLLYSQIIALGGHPKTITQKNIEKKEESISIKNDFIKQFEDRNKLKEPVRKEKIVENYYTGPNHEGITCGHYDPKRERFLMQSIDNGYDTSNFDEESEDYLLEIKHNLEGYYRDKEDGWYYSDYDDDMDDRLTDDYYDD